MHLFTANNICHAIQHIEYCAKSGVIFIYIIIICISGVIFIYGVYNNDSLHFLTVLVIKLHE